jgi:hypothetical protein
LSRVDAEYCCIFACHFDSPFASFGSSWALCPIRWLPFSTPLRESAFRPHCSVGLRKRSGLIGLDS